MADCGKVYERCVCIRAEGHPGPCACDCGGITNGAEVWAWPSGRENVVTRETVEAHVAAHPEKQSEAQAMMALLAHLGFGFEDEDDEDG